MAYSSTVTKIFPTQLTADDMTIGVTVVMNDGVADVWTETFTVRFYSGVTIASLKAEIEDLIKIKVDSYAAERAIYDDTDYDTFASDIESDIDTYANL